MDEQIKALVSQIRILEEQANDGHKTPTERAALFKAAGRIKNQVATLLNQQGQQQSQQQGGKSRIPDPSEYFGDNLTQQQREWFSDNLTPEMKSYFNNLTDEQRAYFDPSKNIQHFDAAPDGPKQQQPVKAQDDDEEAALRKRIFAALGIFY